MITGASLFVGRFSVLLARPERRPNGRMDAQNRPTRSRWQGRKAPGGRQGAAGRGAPADRGAPAPVHVRASRYYSG